MNRPLTREEVPGLCFIVAGPSGVGKASLLRRLLDETPGLALVHSLTTRPSRGDDAVLGKYQFVDLATFRRHIEDNDLLEWAQVHGHYYGTPLAQLRSAAQTGADLVLELDYQGAAQAKPLLPDVVTIFIEPPDLEALSERMHKRGTEGSEEEIQVRLRTAQEELRHRGEFDYVILNDDFEKALAALRDIVAAERARAHRVVRRAEAGRSAG